MQHHLPDGPELATLVPQVLLVLEDRLRARLELVRREEVPQDHHPLVALALAADLVRLPREQSEEPTAG